MRCQAETDQNRRGDRRCRPHHQSGGHYSHGRGEEEKGCHNWQKAPPRKSGTAMLVKPSHHHPPPRQAERDTRKFPSIAKAGRPDNKQAERSWGKYSYFRIVAMKASKPAWQNAVLSHSRVDPRSA